jgi:hypothetical protein
MRFRHQWLNISRSIHVEILYTENLPTPTVGCIRGIAEEHVPETTADEGQLNFSIVFR